MKIITKIFSIYTTEEKVILLLKNLIKIKTIITFIIIEELN